MYEHFLLNTMVFKSLDSFEDIKIQQLFFRIFETLFINS